MAAEVLLVNPSRRRRKSAAKKARARRASPKRRRSLRRNPIGFAANPRRKRRRSFRRNPIGGRGFSIQGTILPTMIGAGGALLTDLAMGLLPIPDTLKTGMLRPVTKAGAAIGIGMLAGMLTNKATGNKIMAGALTVVAYDTIKGFLQTNVPALPLAGVGEYPVIEYSNNMGALLDMDDSMGALVDESSIDGMGNLVDESSIDGMGAIFETPY